MTRPTSGSLGAPRGVRPASALPILTLSLLACNLLAATGGTATPTLEVIRENGSETRPDGAVRLTVPPPGASDQNPAFAPDGGTLVFTRFEAGYNDGPAALFLLRLDLGEVARLTPVEDQDNVNLPGSSWSAADRIVFASDRMDAFDLWRIARDGSDLSRITRHAGPDEYLEPSWSPDGEWIVFERSLPGEGDEDRRGQIWKVRADGNDPTQLTGDGPSDDRQPNWSPAGDRIVFQRRALPDGEWDLYTIAPDGSDLRNVTESPDSSDTDAAWSPDGRQIVYSSDGGGLPVPNLFAIPADGGAPVRLTRSATFEDSAPSWSPDGTWIAFESHMLSDEDEGPASLWRIGFQT